MADAEPDELTTPEELTALRRPLPSWLSWPSHSLRYRVHVRMYALATLIRLTLPDAVSKQWFPEVLIHWLGAVVLLATGSLLGWLLCIGAILIELLTLSDQLTQTAYLGLVALGALACFIGTPKRREERMHFSLAAIVRTLTVGTYFLAAFHKVNRDFLNPAVSCASGGMHVLAEHYGSGSIASIADWRFWPYLFLTAEFGLVVTAIVRPSLGAIYAALLHLPLTIIFAPAFAFTMASGWVALLSEEELRQLAQCLRARWRRIALTGSLPIALSLGLPPYARWQSDPDWCVKEAVLWLVLAWLLVAYVERRRLGSPPERWFGAWRELSARSNQRAARGARRWAAIACALWLTNGFLPYTGLNFQHTGAMLSNLRVDAGCYNHLLVPERFRFREEYIRLDEVAIDGQQVTPADYTNQLFNAEILGPQLAAWCRSAASGVRLRGNYGLGSFDVPNACEPGALPWSSGLSHFRRFQRNLSRTCPQACVH
ncbi:MAG: hypothetical protein AB7K71_16460 [Polyangiaceae bacterium]